jgi:microcin C transport system substrate-binding protein
MKLTRRTVLRSTAAVLAAPALGALSAEALAQPAAVQTKQWKHGLSLFGDVKYPEGFSHFDYVNPAAPQGGTVRFGAFGTFDNFNQVVDGVKGNLAAGVNLITEQLTTMAFDEVASAYGLLAEAVSYPDDRTFVTYRLRANARWHDGQPITVDDVLWSLETWKANSPFYGAYYRHVKKVEKSGERDITFHFDGPGNRELPQIVGELQVMPKHWWEGTDKSGKKRDVTQTTLEIPLGSGPYRLARFEPGHTVVYEQVADYWGKNLNVNVGTNNFGQLRFEYYRDAVTLFEAFKGDNLDWRTENKAQNWAIAYNFSAAREKKVVREEFAVRSQGNMQAFAFNIRRDKFKDPRVRRAFNFAFDFDRVNKELFYGLYKRIDSYFAGTELASSGLPQGLELEILNTVRDKVPADLFSKPYTNPSFTAPQDARNNLREALRLFREAGYEVRDTRMVDSKSGAQFSVEFLYYNQDFERINLNYKQALDRLGVQVSLRMVDPAQYENRVRNWDFDIITASWGESLSPGNEQRGFWSSAAADQQGSRNYVGIKNPAVDTLIDRVIFAKNRDELVAATKALDRVLLWNDYVVPQWFKDVSWTARWDRFNHPQKMPEYAAAAFPTIWWWDADKAAKVPQRS